MRSPADVTDIPKLSLSARRGPFWVVALTSAARFTVPSAFISIMCTAPLPGPSASPPPVAPAARSGTPSPLRSPADVTDIPKLSLPARRGPFWAVALISTVRFIMPSAFIVPLPCIQPPAFISIMCTAPALETPAASSFIAPTARSGTPSPLMSPADVTDMPKKSLSASRGPFSVPPLISAVFLTVPSAPISIMCTEPLSVPPAPSSPGAPAARSGTPSPSRSPTNATDRPKESRADRSGPFRVELPISAVLLITPSRFISITCTAPALEPPAPSSPVAPTARSYAPSPSRSPRSATDTPKLS